MIFFEKLKNSQEMFLSLNKDRALPGMIQNVVMASLLHLKAFLCSF